MKKTVAVFKLYIYKRISILQENNSLFAILLGSEKEVLVQYRSLVRHLLFSVFFLVHGASTPTEQYQRVYQSLFTVIENRRTVLHRDCFVYRKNELFSYTRLFNCVTYRFCQRHNCVKHTFFNHCTFLIQIQTLTS